ncbi:hypothetical protein N7457_006470 [Penicillium paradoxum]|uniref:uncharacterized protein n=1 Tax=Penicillium paradoxum TaxID=176176 RepID=UPI002546D1FC|nr:uncharacterized protein N7457_006470 [Penicillium paradoxum]KAJ5781310.1 hypothetical protein N7457_006470 [Penicillium paradoxum]
MVSGVFSHVWYGDKVGAYTCSWLDFLALPVTKYDWGIFQTGLAQLPSSLVALIGTVFNRVRDWIYISSANRNQKRPGKPKSEVRLYHIYLVVCLSLVDFSGTARPA